LAGAKVRVVFLAPAAAGALLATMPTNGLAGDPSANRHLDCEASAFQEYNAALLKLQGIEVTPGCDPTIDEKHLQGPFSIERPSPAADWRKVSVLGSLLATGALEEPVWRTP
jgi:hypothetical protein